MASLIAVRYLAGALTVLDLDASGSGTGSTLQITAPGARDGSDITHHALTGLDDQGGPTSADGETRVFGALDLPVPDNAIAFLRVRVRVRHEVVAGPGPGVGSAAFFYGGMTLPLAPLSGLVTFTNLEADYPTNPVSGQAWTAADLLSLQIGFVLALSHSDATFSTVSMAELSEFAVEVWGDAGGAKAVVKSGLGSDILAPVAEETGIGAAALGSEASAPVTEERGISGAALGADLGVAFAEERGVDRATHSDDVERAEASGVLEE